MEALSGYHLNILLLHVLRLLNGWLRHVILLLVVHWWVPMTEILNRWRSYIIILNNFLNVHCRLMLFLVWEHKVVLGSELRCNRWLIGDVVLLLHRRQ